MATIADPDQAGQAGDEQVADSGTESWWRRAVVARGGLEVLRACMMHPTRSHRARSTLSRPPIWRAPRRVYSRAARRVVLPAASSGRVNLERASRPTELSASRVGERAMR
eukprot:3577516-Pyramimonas_sp.AAC.1